MRDAVAKLGTFPRIEPEASGSNGAGSATAKGVPRRAIRLRILVLGAALLAVAAAIGVTLAKGKLAGALAIYRESLEIGRAPAATDPSNTLLPHDPSVNLTQADDALAAQRDPMTAVTNREGVDSARELAATDPGKMECPGNPDALGTERTMAVDPAQHQRIGAMQYEETLPLTDKEVVLTFDDGPLPPYTARILDLLASECVKVTFFMIGRQARAHPEWVRRVYNEGHTVASHSQNHPRIFPRLSLAKAEVEIEDGIGSITAALGDPKALAPFFRFPGLGRSQAIEAYLASRGIMVWSADVVADDWRRIKPQEIVTRALDRLERRGKGVLLLHDIHPATVLALPALLRELKARGYRIVHVVSPDPDRPKSVPEPESWASHAPKSTGWPRAIEPGTPPALSAPSVKHYQSPRISQRVRTRRSMGVRKHNRGRRHRFALHRRTWKSFR
jgi:peptidoglycan/xylan/chitin deacetylase (PgdA/CDA1 family)